MLKEDLQGDVEEGGGEEGPFDPNTKTCYTPMVEKVQPVVQRIQPVVETAATHISGFFADDENEIMTEETIDGEVQEKTMLRVTPTTFGAAIVGMTVGTVVAGPIIGIALAGGAGYASTRSDKLGEVSKTVGKKTYNGLRRGYFGSKEFMEAKLALARGTPPAVQAESQPVVPVAVAIGGPEGSNEKA